MSDREEKSANNLDVLVVGAGPTGLILALELARRDINIRIVDKNSGPSTTSKALAIHSRSLEMLENMDLVQEFLKRGVELKGVNIHADNKRIAHFSFEELDSLYPFALSIPQNITEEILIAALAKNGIRVEWNTVLLDLNDSGRHVSARVKQGGGEEEVISTNYLVGCDGAHSTVRHELGLAFEGEKYPETWILGDVVAEGDLREDEINLFNTDEGLLAFFPYGGGRFRVVADKEADPALSKNTEKTYTEYTAPTLEELQDAVDRRSYIKEKLSDPLWTSSFSIHRRHVSKYRINRVFLAGDAAHIHSPAGGQGMNTGMQDSFNLGWKLALAVNNLVTDSFLDSYEEERLAVALSVLQMTDFITKVNTTRNPIAQHIRNRLAPILSAQEVIQKRIRNNVSEHALNYRKSPIVQEDFPNLLESVSKSGSAMHQFIDFKHGPPAGELAPDAFLCPDGSSENPVRLHELLKMKDHVLLIFSSSDSDNLVSEVEQIAELTCTGTNLDIDIFIIASNDAELKQLENLKETARVTLLTDWELSAHHKYGARGNCLYLLRPDGYIGYRCQPVQSARLKEHLEKNYLNNEMINISAV